MLSPADFPVLRPWMRDVPEHTRSARRDTPKIPECVARWEDDGGAIGPAHYQSAHHH